MPEAGSQIPESNPQVPETLGTARGSSRIRHFSDLQVWQKAFSLGLEVFSFSKTWPIEERYALTDQVRRSSRSVSANIAEAWGKRRYEAHFVSKLTDADTELLETENWLLYAKEHGYLSAADFHALHERLREIGRMLGGIMRNPGPFLIRDTHREG